MSVSLAQRIHSMVQQVLGGYPGAWLLWCDPRGEWAPLLERVASDARLGGFSLVVVAETTAGETGGPLIRRQLQERLDAGESLVVLARAGADNLGWLWAQALLAERIYARSLREQLLEWGWRPQSLTIADEELAALARQYAGQDPQDWGGGGLQPDLALLVRVLAGLDQPTGDSRLVLDATVEAAGLPPLDEENLPLWRTRALARLLVTQAHHAALERIGAGHELLIPAQRRGTALALLDRWNDSFSLRGKLASAIVEADKVAALGALFTEPLATPATAVASSAAMRLQSQASPFLSRAAETAAFSATCRGLATLAGKDLLEAVAARLGDFSQRAEGFWGADWPELPAIPWREAQRLAEAAQLVLAASPTAEWPSPEHAYSWYVQGGWRVDRAGEELLRALPRPHPDLVALLGPLREAYRNRWEDLLIRWSDVWSAAGCPMLGLPSAGDWLKGALSPKIPTAVIVVDALRFDLGATIVERLNAQEGARRAEVAAARAPLPSVTALGMGMALPIAESALEAELVGGAWQLRQKGQPANLSAAADRRAWWQEHGGATDEALVRFAALIEGELPRPGEHGKRLVIHDDALDKLGHDDQLEALGAELVLARYVTAMGRLREAGWRRILMVTDHGYIHWDGAAERQAPQPLAGALYTNRRALAYAAGTSLPPPQALAPGGRYRVALPSGAACFKTYGGLGYFHGGASLQEWIIPCIKAEWPARAAPVTVELVPLAKMLSLRVRVTLRVTRPGLFAEDVLSRRVSVVIRTVPANTIIFRSAEVTITPDRETASVTLEPTTEAAPRGAAVRIEVRDAATDQVIATGDSVLMVEKDDWAEAPSEW